VTLTSEGLHEARELLDEVTVDRHRALISLQEELQAIDWYDQRVAATHDLSLAAVLAHNRDEEKEHAAMILEWLRRGDPILDRKRPTAPGMMSSPLQAPSETGTTPTERGRPEADPSASEA
jgi:hypothetical protein